MKQTNGTNGTGERSSDLRQSPMMAHLLDALEAGTDIGHYGRLTFVMVARHFLAEEELVQLLSGQPEMDEKAARMLVLQVQERDYNPPQRQKILEWQSQQEFPICPDADDPNSCNVYRELQFPQQVYDHVEEYYEERAEAQMQSAD
jgi:DNA primase large subunit